MQDRVGTKDEDGEAIPEDVHGATNVGRLDKIGAIGRKRAIGTEANSASTRNLDQAELNGE